MTKVPTFAPNIHVKQKQSQISLVFSYSDLKHWLLVAFLLPQKIISFGTRFPRVTSLEGEEEKQSKNRHFRDKKTRVLQYTRAAQLMGQYLVKFDLPRQRAESRMPPGKPFPEAFIQSCVSRPHPYPGVINHWFGPVRRGVWGVAAVARHMRRLCGPMGTSERREVLMARVNEDKPQMMKMMI